MMEAPLTLFQLTELTTLTEFESRLFSFTVVFVELMNEQRPY